jgi:cytochrome P450
MQRKATSDITLDDGAVIPKGADIAFPLEATRDGTFYENGDKYDGYRYVKLRSKPGEHHRWQFASVGKEQLSFGNGKYACPGRAFASNMIKLMLAHLIMKYDWRFVEGKKPQWLYDTATLRMLDPLAEIEYMSRTSEIGFEGGHYEAFQHADLEH